MIHAKVLVVDHEQGAYDVLKSGLAKCGYEMHTTTTMANVRWRPIGQCWTDSTLKSLTSR